MLRIHSHELPLFASSLVETLSRNAGNHATICLLNGCVGAGKTTLAQHIGNYLGVTSMSSPTFTFIKTYTTHHADYDILVHGDMYRLEHETLAIDLKLDSYIASKRTCIILEWPEFLVQQLPDLFKSIPHGVVTLQHEDDIDSNVRIIDTMIIPEKGFQA